MLLAMTKKSSAQIKRNTRRAEARGEVYVAPVPVVEPKQEALQECSKDVDLLTDDPATVARRTTAEKLQKALKALEDNQDLKAKDRRSEKRKAMAIATEESGMPAEELLEWFQDKHDDEARNDVDARQLSEPADAQHRSVPYIAFVGQLSFSTTKEMLYDHIQKALANEKLRVTQETLRIRLLTSAKSKKSRGMAFVEVFDPEILYALLKLHHTMLDNRRINVERSTGGGKEGKKEKIQQFRLDQQAFMLSQVKQIIQEYVDRKEVTEGELDETALLVCTRHSPVVVLAALDTYVEKNGREMDNPSAYFTFLITKLAEEGVPQMAKPVERQRRGADDRKRTREDGSTKQPARPTKHTSEFAKNGVDMSVSEPPTTDLSYIFPSSKRGRGRGR